MVLLIVSSAGLALAFILLGYMLIMEGRRIKRSLAGVTAFLLGGHPGEPGQPRDGCRQPQGTDGNPCI